MLSQVQHDENLGVVIKIQTLLNPLKKAKEDGDPNQTFYKKE